MIDAPSVRHQHDCPTSRGFRRDGSLSCTITRGISACRKLRSIFHSCGIMTLRHSQAERVACVKESIAHHATGIAVRRRQFELLSG